MEGIKVYLKAVVVLLTFCIMPGIVYAQSTTTVPPGGAALLWLPGQNGDVVAIESFEAPRVGTAYFLEGKTKIAYQAPSEVEANVSVSLSYKLVDEAVARFFVIDIDPYYSSINESVTGTTLEWLVVLLVLALFIEASVLVVVALIRAFYWYTGGRPKLGTDGPKPSLYKSVFALALSVLAVLGFGLDPLNDIVGSFNSDSAIAMGNQTRAFADFLITSLLLAGGAESVRRVATGVMTGLGVPRANELDEEAVNADTRKQGK